MAKNVLSVYNLAKIGVDVDTDNLHAPTGGFRQAQNVVPNPTLTQAESIVSRKGLRALNSLALGTGPVLGGITIPAFEAGSGEASLFLGFGD
jgi:hypothetical protein